MTSPAPIHESTRARSLADAVAWSIGPAFALLAAWLYFASPAPDVLAVHQPAVDPAGFVPGARRSPIGEPPAAMSGGFAHACNECHRLFDSPPMERRTLTQHTGITFSHGMNDSCFNCHDREDREKLVLHDGTLIGFDEVPRLCSQCHGTVFRDWQLGTHGKTMGSWDAASGLQVRLECNDCHDPHSPAYGQVAPLPAPRTLRMGDQSPVEHHPDRHRPLRRWPGPEHAAPGAGHAPPAHREEGRP